MTNNFYKVYYWHVTARRSRGSLDGYATKATLKAALLVMPESICRASMTVFDIGSISILFSLKVADDVDSRLLISGVTDYVYFSVMKSTTNPRRKSLN